MLDQVGGLLASVGLVVRASHERYDGGGYPDGLAGEAIPLAARIVAVCDAFNAMTTTRSYRKAMPVVRGRRRSCARCAGTQFDPAVVEALLAVVGDPGWEASLAPAPARRPRALPCPPLRVGAGNAARLGRRGRRGPHGDLTAALGYRTPAGGAVALAVAPVGLHDRAAGTVGFTTSLGLLEEARPDRRDPRVALAFHAREHGASSSPALRARPGPRHASTPRRRRRASRRSSTQAERYLGEAPRGRFWDFWLREYGDVRVPADVEVERIVVWPDLRCAGEPRGARRAAARAAGPAGAAEARAPARGSTWRARPSASRKTATCCSATAAATATRWWCPWRSTGSGPAACGSAPPRRCRRAAAGPACSATPTARSSSACARARTPAGSRAALYAPHTEAGYVAPPNKTLLLLLNGGLAKRGVRKARRAGKLRAGRGHAGAAASPRVPGGGRSPRRVVRHAEPLHDRPRAGVGGHGERHDLSSPSILETERTEARAASVA